MHALKLFIAEFSELNPDHSQVCDTDSYICFLFPVGRSVKIAGLGHAHLQFGEVKKNFSHRIDGLTFGDRISGMMYALDGEHKIAPTSEYSFQYYVQVAY